MRSLKASIGESTTACRTVRVDQVLEHARREPPAHRPPPIAQAKAEWSRPSAAPRGAPRNGISPVWRGSSLNAATRAPCPARRSPAVTATGLAVGKGEHQTPVGIELPSPRRSRCRTACARGAACPRSRRWRATPPARFAAPCVASSSHSGSSAFRNSAASASRSTVRPSMASEIAVSRISSGKSACDSSTLTPMPTTIRGLAGGAALLGEDAAELLASEHHVVRPLEAGLDAEAVERALECQAGEQRDRRERSRCRVLADQHRHREPLARRGVPGPTLAAAAAWSGRRSPP